MSQDKERLFRLINEEIKADTRYQEGMEIYPVIGYIRASNIEAATSYDWDRVKWKDHAMEDIVICAKAKAKEKLFGTA
jgi:hypothetical protein